jgi:hypothetical protein
VVIGWVAPGAAHSPIADIERVSGAGVERTPDDADGWARRGELRRLDGRRTDARRDIARVLELDPDHPGALLSRAQLALDDDHPDIAITAATAALEHGAAGALRTAALVTRSRAVSSIGRHAEALDDLDEAITGAQQPTPELILERLELVQRLGAEGGWTDDQTEEIAAAGLDEGLARIGPAVSLVRAADRLGATSRQGRGVSSQPVVAPVQSAVQPFLAGDRLGSPVAQLVRGPYLQRATSTSIILRWRTDLAIDSRVWYGPDPAHLETVVDDPAVIVDHVVELSGLAPETCFSYAVGSSAQVLAGGDADHQFCTPSADSEASLVVWVIGDSGTANANAAAVRDAYLASGIGVPPDVWLMLGDNAYPDGTDAQYQAAVFDMYPSLLRQVAVWPAFGNHDAHSASSLDQTGPYFEIFSLPTMGEAGGLASGSEAYYAFDSGPVHFVCLDSAGLVTPSEAMLDWLAADLAATDRPWTIAYFHHPPYTKGSHDSDNLGDSGGRMTAMREVVLPILESYGVDLVLSGHSHSYERSFLIDGHYGTSDTLAPAMVIDGGDGSVAGDGAYVKAAAPHHGAVYAVAGSSGQTGGGPLDHPVMHVSLDELGSMVLTVQGDAWLEGVFLDSGTPGLLRDQFRIMRDPTAVFIDGMETGDASRWSVVSP